MSNTIPEVAKDMLEKIIGSAIYKKALHQAPRLAKNTQGILRLLRTALRKTQHLGVGGIVDVLREKVTTLGTLLRFYASGEYRQIEVGNLIKIIAGFIYFIAPIDLIPDFLPFIGFSDDVALFVYLMKSIDDELQKFERWKNDNRL